MAYAAAADVEIRHLETHEERDACVHAQRRIWGEDFDDVVPASMINATQKAGGIAAGAFRGNEELVGFVYGLPAVRDGTITHWSHMLGVVKTCRGQGVGKGLKFFQRECVLARGVTEMSWTFDPLVAGNAHFNLNILGVRIAEYVADMYGETGSDLHALGTDRLVAHWKLDSAPVGHASDRAHGVDWEGAEMLNSNLCPSDRLALLMGERPPEAVRISIPRDIFAVNRRDPATGREWRRATREAFRSAWEEGYRIVGFSHSADASYCHYLLLLHFEAGTGAP